MQTTFSIIKPDAVKLGNAGKILALLEGAGFRIAALRMLKLSKSQAEGFYAVHKERPFYNSLVTFMTEGPVIVMALEREDAVKKLREVMARPTPPMPMRVPSASCSRKASSAIPSTVQTRRKPRPKN